MNRFDADGVRFVLCDLDGVVWLSHQAIPGGPDAIAAIRASGRRVLFATNNSFATIGDVESALAAIGVPAVGDVVSSAQAAALLLTPGDTALVGGGPGVFEALTARGVTALSASDVDADASVDAVASFDAVVVGLHRDFDYQRLTVLSGAVRRGARFIGTNDDATYPTPDGPVPGGGAIVAAVATAAGVAPTLAGKPHGPMAELVRVRCGSTYSDAAALMVGDRWSTDGAFAVTLGCAYAQVRSGVTPPGAALEGPAALDVADLAAVAAALTR